jgi:hypothetical protein
MAKQRKPARDPGDVLGTLKVALSVPPRPKGLRKAGKRGKPRGAK